MGKTISRTATLVLAVFAAGFAQAAPHWDYKGHHGASHWGELDKAFEACAKGTRQSPIDIRMTEKVNLPDLNFQYTAVAPTIWNNGHTVQVNVPSGNKLVVGDQTYDLLQFHFHTPSEEAINGKHYPMVAHFVHKNAAGQLGVVGVLIKKGKKNQDLAPVFEHIPRTGEKITVDDLTLNLSNLVPANHTYYSFEGSLTTPPCSEDVNWMVMKHPIELSSIQIRAFAKTVKFNARPIQPSNNRTIKESL